MMETAVVDVDAYLSFPFWGNLDSTRLYHIHSATYLANSFHVLKFDAFGALLDKQQRLNDGRTIG